MTGREAGRDRAVVGQRATVHEYVAVAFDGVVGAVNDGVTVAIKISDIKAIDNAVEGDAAVATERAVRVETDLGGRVIGSGIHQDSPVLGQDGPGHHNTIAA